MVSLIAATRTTTGRKIHFELNTGAYANGVKVSGQESAYSTPRSRSSSALSAAASNLRRSRVT